MVRYNCYVRRCLIWFLLSMFPTTHCLVFAHSVIRTENQYRINSTVCLYRQSAVSKESRYIHIRRTILWSISHWSISTRHTYTQDNPLEEHRGKKKERHCRLDFWTVARILRIPFRSTGKFVYWPVLWLAWTSTVMQRPHFFILNSTLPQT